MNRKILKIAIPAIATNITIPLLSMVDVAIAGHLGNESFIGAISVGSTLINLFYWNFGFLRMGTSGLTAQAFGAKNFPEAINTLLRSVFVSLLACIIIFLLKSIVQKVAFDYMNTSPEVEEAAILYLNICILGAPAVMCLYSFKGWFIGMQNSVYPMIIAISINIINIICSLISVFVLNLGIAGIAIGSLIAQYCGILIAILLWRKKYNNLFPLINKKEIFDTQKLKRFTTLNGGIAIRTVCLTAVTCFFTLAGAKQGTILLAVNTLLMQLFSIFSYFTDGFAYAGEALTGRYIGAKDPANMNKSIVYLFLWGFGLVGIFTIIYFFFTPNILSILTDKGNVINAANDYLPWVVAIPICGFSAFLWDGIMVGATMAKGMVCAMIFATVSFFLLYNLLITNQGNDGLWIAFLTYLSMRGIVQTIYFTRKKKSLFAPSK